MSDQRPAAFQGPTGVPVRHAYQSTFVSVPEARVALSRMALASPEYRHLAEVVSALLVRLDTIRDEAHFGARLTRHRLRAQDLSGARRSNSAVMSLTAGRDGRHHLLLRCDARPDNGGRDE